MSLTKRFMEIEEEAEILVSALDALIENEAIEHKASLGISKQIVADRSIDNLSQKQIQVFQKHIEPLLTPSCERDECIEKISIRDLPDAYLNAFDFGGLFCGDCQYEEGRIQNLKG